MKIESVEDYEGVRYAMVVAEPSDGVMTSGDRMRRVSDGATFQIGGMEALARGAVRGVVFTPTDGVEAGDEFERAWLPGDRVRMTATLKARMRGGCAPGKHVPPHEGEPPLDPTQPDDGCRHCSTAHIEEFGECVGVVVGRIDDWPEYDVRWEPSGLKYGYAPEDLERAT